MMLYSSILKMEKQILSLPKIEQLRIIEKIVHHLRENDLKKKKNIEFQLCIMAQDEEIQNEIKEINKEFLQTENDGL